MLPLEVLPQAQLLEVLLGRARLEVRRVEAGEQQVDFYSLEAHLYQGRLGVRHILAVAHPLVGLKALKELLKEGNLCDVVRHDAYGVNVRLFEMRL